MNVLLISPYFSPMVGGVETHLDDLCSFFNKQRHKVFVRTYKALGAKDRGITNEKREYINIHRFWWPDFNLIFRLESYPILKFIYLFPGLFLDCLIFLIRQSKSVDVIQAHGFIAALMAVILGKIFSKKVVINTHVGFNLSDGIMTKIIKWALINSVKILVLTEGIKTSLVDLGIPKEKIAVYHYWVDQKKFKTQENAKRKLKWEDKFIVLFVGRLIEIKGVRRIFELAKRLTNITFVIIGAGILSEELRKKSKDYSNIIFLGKIDNKTLPVYYSGADLLLLPSKIITQEYEEGNPRVMIEALSCGLPVISTRAGGIPEILDEKVGRLISDNPEKISQVIDGLYKNRDLLKSISNNCRQYAKDAFSIKNAYLIERSLME